MRLQCGINGLLGPLMGTYGVEILHLKDLFECGIHGLLGSSMGTCGVMFTPVGFALPMGLQCCVYGLLGSSMGTYGAACL